MIRELVTIGNLEDALWWLTRWVSGSMTDPEWKAEGVILNVDQAFSLLQRFTKPKTQLLWRYLLVSKPVANKIVTTKMLPRARYCRYQSFTVSKIIAIKAGREINPTNERMVEIVVSANVPGQLIMFNMKDFYKSKIPIIKEAVSTIDIWEYQKEVVVKIDKPFKLKTIEILG